MGVGQGVMKTGRGGSKRERWVALAAKPTTLEEICDRVATGETVEGIARRWEVPGVQVWKWLWSEEGRRRAYERAQELAAYRLMEEVVGIADEAEETSAGVAKARLRIETRYRVSEAHARERYGREREMAKGGGVVQVVVQREMGVGELLPVMIEGTGGEA